MEMNLKASLYLYVPFSELMRIVSNELGPAFKANSKDKVIEKLERICEESPSFEDHLREITANYRYAGKGSISWGFIENEKLNKNNITQAITISNSDNIFVEAQEPELSSKPKLNRAQWISDNLLKLQFVYVDSRPITVMRDYEPETFFPTKMKNVFLKIGSGLIFIECRAAMTKAKALRKAVADMLGMQVKVITFSEEEIQQIKDNLHASLRGAKHKLLAGEIDMISFSAEPNYPDLSNSNAYSDMISESEIRKAIFRFENPSTQAEVTVHLSTHGGVWFVSIVPEVIIDHVFSCIRSVKGLE